MYSPNQLSVVILTLIALVSLSTVGRANEEEVRAAISKYVEAFNAKDVDAITKMWADDAVHVDLETDSVTEGRDAIVADLKAVFENNSTLTISGKIEHLKLIKEDIATISGNVVLSDLRRNPTVSHFNALLLKSNGTWLIEKMEESPAMQPNNARVALGRLGWLVGTWEDNASKPPVKSIIAWTQNEAFLTRTTETKDENGIPQRSTQIIGWDPRINQIRSWTFHTDGSFGEGIWSERDEGWQINASQILTNGSHAVGTYIINRVDDDSFTIQLIGRETNGEPQPSTDAVTVKRITETPKVEATSSK